MNAPSLAAAGLGANTVLVLLGCGIFGALAGAVGTFVIARRRSLIADVAGHAALPGVCLAFLAGEALHIGGRTPWLLLIGAACTALLAAWFVPWLTRRFAIGADGATAVSLALFFGLGAVLLSLVQSHESGSQGGLRRLLFGSAAATSSADVKTLAALALVTLVALALLFKELSLLAFDEQHARTLGFPVRSLDLLLTLLLVATVVAGMQLAGIVLVVSMVITPAATARFFHGSIARVTAIAAGFGAASAVCGVLVSLEFEHLPTGPAMTLCAAGLFVLALLATTRGRAEAVQS